MLLCSNAVVCLFKKMSTRKVPRIDNQSLKIYKKRIIDVLVFCVSQHGGQAAPNDPDVELFRKRTCPMWGTL